MDSRLPKTGLFRARKECLKQGTYICLPAHAICAAVPALGRVSLTDFPAPASLSPSTTSYKVPTHTPVTWLAGLCHRAGDSISNRGCSEHTAPGQNPAKSNMSAKLARAAPRGPRGRRPAPRVTRGTIRKSSAAQPQVHRKREFEAQVAKERQEREKREAEAKREAEKKK